MKKLLTTALFVTAIFVSPLSLAAEKTIKLSVPGMTCASCPYIVKAAISEVAGILAVEAMMEDRSATVTYDDAIASLDNITQATANVGYPSSLFNTGSDS